ncbi:NAD(P)/FAD-dependent oxidoreductase [Streptomyces winkii]|uniref:NAD(P)/FAD-dependent oxidoreductase n=1 Tax=Streptomyces winkii TaxID=3051178 RepID=UPI0028D11E72|nr:FAD-dependent oxidoreductase [Streptomyces sp. DSM 40971]
MTVPVSVLVVGASAAGLATAEALRRRGYQGTLTVLGDEPHAPYDRPPLSKQILAGHWEHGRAALRDEAQLAGLGAEFVLGDRAVGLDAGARTVRTAAGRTLRADAVVVATGVRTRRLPGQPDLAGAHVLRTLDDALALRSDLLPPDPADRPGAPGAPAVPGAPGTPSEKSGRRLVVVGDGVLGCEVAATARDMGADVTLAGPQPAPMAAQLGHGAAALLARLHTAHGVRLRPGAAVRSLTGERGRVTGVRLETGETLPADVVVVALGAVPATDWLDGSGLRQDDGVVCDSRCRAAESVYAAGDVARWHHDVLGTHVRLENRTNATEQALAVASVMLGGTRPYRPVPYFWTDQFGTKVQMYGRPAADAELTVVEGDMAGGRFVAVHRRGGAVTGVLGWNMPKQTLPYRRELATAYAALAPAA